MHLAVSLSQEIVLRNTVVFGFEVFTTEVRDSDDPYAIAPPVGAPERVASRIDCFYDVGRRPKLCPLRRTRDCGRADCGDSMTRVLMVGIFRDASYVISQIGLLVNKSDTLGVGIKKCVKLHRPRGRRLAIDARFRIETPSRMRQTRDSS